MKNKTLFLISTCFLLLATGCSTIDSSKKKDTISQQAKSNYSDDEIDYKALYESLKNRDHNNSQDVENLSNAKNEGSESSSYDIDDQHTKYVTEYVTKEPDHSPGNLKIYVEIDPFKENGKPWDVGGGAPDIALCITSMNEIKCVPDGGTPGGVLRPQCRDAFKCSFEIPVPFIQDDFFVEVMDVDVMLNDTIGKGRCRINNQCRLGQSVISVR